MMKLAEKSANLAPHLRRSDHLRDRFPSPSPDFLWNLMALANFMRLSLLKGAHVASSGAEWQEIRVPGWADVWRSALRALKEPRFHLDRMRV
jgi:hypothetical protein